MLMGRRRKAAALLVVLTALGLAASKGEVQSDVPFGTIPTPPEKTGYTATPGQDNTSSYLLTPSFGEPQLDTIPTPRATKR